MVRTLPETVKRELWRALHAPYETPIVVGVNGALMTVLWFLVPSNVLFTFHGSLAYPMVLASWMYSDVPATNVIGTDAASSLAALPNEDSTRRLLRARTLVLWIFVAPICSIIGIVLGLIDHRPFAVIFTTIWITVVPIGALPLAGWLGIYHPYHPMPLRRRWELRRRWWPILGRWLTLALLPYAIVPLLIVLLSAPSLILWWATWPQWRQDRIPDWLFGIGVLLACATTALAWWYGSSVGASKALRRRDQLTDFLENPDAG